MGISTTQCEVELANLLGATTFVPPTAIWTGLYSVMPSDSTAGVEITSTSGYTRIQTTGWEMQTRLATNSSVVLFPVNTAPQSSVVGVGIFSSSNAANYLRAAGLTIDREATIVGDQLKFSTGALIWRYATSTDL